MATTPTTNDHPSDGDLDVEEVTPLFSVDGLDDATKQRIINHVTHGHGWRPNVMRPFPEAIAGLFTTQLSPPEPHKPTSSLGVFGRLAVELQWMVLLQMDITTLIRFSQTYRLARTVVQTLPEFRNVTTYAGTTLFMAVIATRLSDFFSIARLHDTLTTWQCAQCGYSFGDFVFLPFLERYCVHCLTSPEVNKKCRLRSMAWRERHVAMSRTPPCVIRSWRGGGELLGLGLVVFPTELQDDYIQLEKRKDVRHLSIRGDKTWWTVLNLGPPPPLHEQRKFLRPETLDLYNLWLPEEDPDFTDQAESLDWAHQAIAIAPKHVGPALTIAVPYLANASTREVINHGVRCCGLGCEEDGIWLPSEYLEEHFPWCQGAVDMWRAAQERAGQGQSWD